jgi:iron(III) transport system substrate-binding protein
LRFVLPAGRTLVNADAVGILRGAPNRAVARRFVDFLLSDEAGAIWMLKPGAKVGELHGPRRHGLNRATVLPRLFERIESEAPDATRVLENPFRMRFDFHYDYALASRRWTLLNDLLAALLIDTRSQLEAAIGAVTRLEGERRREAETVLFALPFEERDLDRILELEWPEPVKRERLRIEWTAFARARYEQVARLAPEDRP